MAQVRKDWLFNLLLVALIVTFGAMTAIERMEDPTEGIETFVEPALTTSTLAGLPDALELPGSETDYGADSETSYSHGSTTPALAVTPAPEPLRYSFIGALDIFRALITPTPTPEPRTPTPTPTPSLARAVNGWEFLYPRGRNPTTFVFSDPRQRAANHEVTEGVPYPIQDGAQIFEVIARPGETRYQVILEYGGQQHEFSLY